jgi:tetratricopeptide (TPR) repeat protein
MATIERLREKQKSLEKLYYDYTEKLHKLRKAIVTESDAVNKLKLEKQIEEIENKLEEIEHDLDLTEEKIRTYELTESFTEMSEYFSSAQELKASGKYEQASENYMKLESLLSEFLLHLYEDIQFAYYHQDNIDEMLIYDKKIDSLLEFLPEKQEEKIKSIKARKYKNLAIAYQKQGKLEKALTLNKESLIIYEDLFDKIAQGKTLNNMGMIYQTIKDKDAAIQCFQKTLKVIDNLEETDEVEELKAAAQNNLGRLYFQMRKYEEALPYLNEALSIFKNIRNKVPLYHCLPNIIQYHAIFGEVETAEKYLDEFIEVSKELGKFSDSRTKFTIMGIYDTIGNKYRMKKQGEKALKYLKRSERFLKEIPEDFFEKSPENMNKNEYLDMIHEDIEKAELCIKEHNQ